MNTVSRAWLWANETDPRTWALHTLVAVVLAFAWSPAVAIGFYAVREAEQVVNRFAIKRAALEEGIEIEEEPAGWLDHIMDVAAPTAAVLLLILLGLEW